MKKIILFLFVLIISTAKSYALPYTTTPPSLSELVKMADHVIEGEVVGLQIVNSKNEIINDPKVEINPKDFRAFILNIKAKKFLKTNLKTNPKGVNVVIDYLGYIPLEPAQKMFIKNKGIFLLKGDNYNYVFANVFQRPVSDMEKIKYYLKNPDAKELKAKVKTHQIRKPKVPDLTGAPAYYKQTEN